MRYLLIMIVLFVAVLAVPQAHAVEMTSLYTVEVPLDPDDIDAQANAYRAALIEVLVRVTGSTAIAEAETMASIFPNPRQFVRQYRPGPDNTLVVSLDGPEIERLLRQSGATVWGTDRPLTVIWLAVDWGMGDREIVAADDPDRISADGRSIDRNRLLRERVQAVATRRGLPVVFPLLDIEDLQNIGFIDIWGGFDEPLLAASARYEAPSVLVGRIRPEDMQPPRWTWYLDGQRFAWPGQPEEAIDQLADALAARDAIRGDQEAEIIEVTISGIHSVSAYGQVQRYMENLRVIQKLSLKSVASDRITYEVEVQGGVERLDSVLGRSSMLERDGRAYAINGSSFRMNSNPVARPRGLEYIFRPAPKPLSEIDPDFAPDPNPEG